MNWLTKNKIHIFTWWIFQEDKTEYNEEAARQKVDYDKAMEEYRWVFLI